MERKTQRIASIVFAAGKGSRMLGYDGNKTLLPLVPRSSIYLGDCPILLEVLKNLPEGPKGIVVHHCAEEVIRAASGFDAAFLHQPVTNGTGGALLAAAPFLETIGEDCVIITMGDVPLIRPETYARLVGALTVHDFVVLAFAPQDRARYGMLEMRESQVLRIVEWKYWHEFPAEEQARLRFCNAGVYAARRPVLAKYLEPLSQKAHTVRKQRGDTWVTIEEYFLTDLVELMRADGLSIGVVEAPEDEVAGVDTPEALRSVQRRFAETAGSE